MDEAIVIISKGQEATFDISVNDLAAKINIITSVANMFEKRNLPDTPEHGSLHYKLRSAARNKILQFSFVA